jgi:hypothetical protein
MGQLERVLQLSREARRWRRSWATISAWRASYTYLINYHYLKGEPELAGEYGEAMPSGSVTASTIPRSQALARGYLGYSYHAQGHYPKAEAVLKQNVEALESAWGDQDEGHRPESPSSRQRMARVHARRIGEFDAATTYLDHAERAAAASGHAFSTHHRPHAWPASSGCVAASLDRALPVASEEPGRLPGEEPRCLAAAALVPARARLASCSDRMDEGLPSSRRRRVADGRVRRTRLPGALDAHLGEGLLADDQVEARAHRSRSARSIWRGHTRSAVIKAWALFLLGEIASHGSEPPSDTAREFYAQAPRPGRGAQDAAARGASGVEPGRLHAKANDRDKPRITSAKALGLLRAMDSSLLDCQSRRGVDGTGHVFIVARDNVQLYDYPQAEFAGEPVTVIVDRRRTNGQQPGAAGATRDGERRRMRTRKRRSTRAVSSSFQNWNRDARPTPRGVGFTHDHLLRTPFHAHRGRRLARFPPHYVDQDTLIAAFRRRRGPSATTTWRVSPTCIGTSSSADGISRCHDAYPRLASFTEANDAWIRVGADVGAAAIEDASGQAGLASATSTRSGARASRALPRPASTRA